MANDKNFLIKNGLQAGRYLQTGGTETAGTEGYNLAGASYDSVSFSVASQDTNPRGVFFKPDGTKMYVGGGASADVNEYDLSIAWDISTASYVQVFSVSAQESSPRDLFFKPDGTKMYIVGDNGDEVNEYNLSTAWDISTSSFNQLFSVSAQETLPFGIFFKPDGTKMYIIGSTGDDVNEYDLSTAWDISSASYLQNFNVSAQDAGPNKVSLKSDGTKMYVFGGVNNSVFQYSLSTAYDLSSASYDGVSFSIAAQETGGTGLFIKPDGTKMYITGTSTNDAVYQYSTVGYTQTLDLSTGTYFSFTPSGATTVSFTNAPASGKAVGFSVEINGDGSAITWPTSVKWHGGVVPVATASKELYAFVTTDGGTTYYGKKAGSDIA